MSTSPGTVDAAPSARTIERVETLPAHAQGIDLTHEREYRKSRPRSRSAAGWGNPAQAPNGTCIRTHDWERTQLFDGFIQAPIRQGEAGAPDNRGKEDRSAGEDAERAPGERHRERLRTPYSSSDQGRGAGAYLRRRPRGTDWHRCRCRARTKKEQRDWEREADPERPEKEEGGERSEEPAGRHKCPRLRQAAPRGGARTQPAAEPEAQGALASGKARQGDQQASGSNARNSDDREPGAHADSPAYQYGGGSGKRRECDGVDQTEHDQGETQCPHAGATAWIAANDGNAHRVVETAGEHDTGQGGAAVAGRKRQWPRPLIRGEQPSPSPRLEALSEKQQQADRYQDAGLTARQQPGAGREVLRGKERKEFEMPVQ